MLTFIVTSDGDEVILGFEGYEWHTHADLLAEAYVTTPEEAVVRFVDSLLSSKAVISVSRRHGKVFDIAITDDPQIDLQYARPDESIEFRRWNGAIWQPGDEPYRIGF